MKFSISRLLLLAFTISSYVLVSPILDESFINTHQLLERGITYPVRPTNSLITEIMTNVEADFYAKVFSSLIGDKPSFDAELKTEFQANIYDRLELNLKNNLGTALLDKLKLLFTLTDFYQEAKSVIKFELPKIGVSLNAKAKNQIDAAISDVQVNIPLVVQLTVSAGVNAKTTINATIQASLKVYAKLNAKASAEAILKSL